MHLCNYLKVNYTFTSSSHSIEFVDGGTLAQALIPMIVEYDSVLVLDTVNVAEAQIGDVYSFPFSAIPDTITWAGSAHEVEMLQTLKMIKLLGDLPPLHIIGIVPKIIGEDTTFNLSSELLSRFEVLEHEVLRYLRTLGFESKKVDSAPIQTIANNSYKGY